MEQHSGYSSGSGRQVIHAIRPAQPHDTKHDTLLTLKIFLNKTFLSNN